jgi:hypothetical protein
MRANPLPGNRFDWCRDNEVAIFGIVDEHLRRLFDDLTGSWVEKDWWRR